MQPQVLAREDFRGGHQSGFWLRPAMMVGHGAYGDDGLAGAYVALDQPAHALPGGEVRLDFGERAVPGRR